MGHGNDDEKLSRCKQISNWRTTRRVRLVRRSWRLGTLTIVNIYNFTSSIVFWIVICLLLDNFSSSFLFQKYNLYFKKFFQQESSWKQLIRYIIISRRKLFHSISILEKHWYDHHYDHGSKKQNQCVYQKFCFGRIVVPNLNSLEKWNNILQIAH